MEDKQKFWIMHLGWKWMNPQHILILYSRYSSI